MTIKTIIIVVSAAFLLAALSVFMMFNKKHRVVEDEAYQRMEACKLFADFSADETLANSQYLDKVVEVTGIVSEVLTNQNGESIILLKTKDPLYGVSCTMQNTTTQIISGTPVTIKGICTGYLSDVVITRGILVVK